MGNLLRKLNSLRVPLNPQEHATLVKPKKGIRWLACGFIMTLSAWTIPPQTWAQTPPYRPSPVISDINWNWSSHRRLAPGSDNWPVTWASNGHQYTAWGDGGGFGGTNSEARVSLGFARVEGSATSYKGYNVWGGKDCSTPAKFGGKSYGILALGNNLYMWRCGQGSGNTAFHFQQLYKSTNGGLSWTAASWKFGDSINFYCPTFLQFGKGYNGARDSWVYMYAAQNNNDTWGIQKPGTIMLMRAPQTRLMERSAYQFFTGRNANGQPQWSANITDRKPVFADPNGVHLVSVSYNPGLRRYLLATAHTAKEEGNLGIFDAPTPWGPWTTVSYEKQWGAGHNIATTTFFWNFANKWLSADGKNFVLVFTGVDSNDAWNTVKGTFVLKTQQAPLAPPPPTGLTISER
jgi:hypothetical protein